MLKCYTAFRRVRRQSPFFTSPLGLTIRLSYSTNFTNASLSIILIFVAQLRNHLHIALIVLHLLQ